MQTVDIDPPVAVIKLEACISLLLTACQPFVESPNTNVTAEPSVFKFKSLVPPSILSDPFAEIVKAFVSKFCA